jgi:phosphate transport system substrate-binding protein
VAINGVLPGTDASKYKLTRPLFLYTDLYALRARSGLAAFINFVLLNVDKEIQAVGYLSGGQAALDESKARFLNVIQGDLLVMGSTTVTPLALSAQSALTTTNYTGYVVVSGVGSGAGFTAFCDKLTSQVAMLSREMSEDEIQKCIKKGRQPIQFRAGSDAFSIVINSRNKFLKNVTIAEFKAIYAAERWSQVNPEWPNERIDHFISDPSTGGFSLIADVIYGGDQKTPLAGPNLRTTFSGVETAERVSQNEYSIGVMAYTFYQQYKDTLQIVTLNGIEPSLENIENGAYKLSRPLNLFSDATIIRNRPQTAAYLYVFLSNLNEDTKRLGYFAPSQRINDENIAKLIKAMQRPESVKP